jgi:hypothetical protein
LRPAAEAAKLRSMRGLISSALAGALLLLPAGAARAAASVQPVTPLEQSVAGGETQVFSARFFDSFGHPAAGATVHFANDACGTFANGQFSIDVAADATGLAAAPFTAFREGITCWLVAGSGVTVQWNVLTFLPENARLAAVLPAPVPPGQGFSFSAAAMYGLYSLYNVDIAARVIPGTASATITPATSNTGQSGTAGFNVIPDGRVGDYQIELRYRDHVQLLAVQGTASPWQDMWWAGSDENGWGMSIVQHRDVLFSVIYAYDDAGKPIWYVMSGGQWNDAHTAYSGALYLPHGAPWSAYDTARFDVGGAIGNATLTFNDLGHAVLDYAIAGVAGHKALSRQPFGPADAAPSPLLGDMWWGGVGQNGWGIAVLQQYRTLFSVWFTYDAAGAPTWFVMPSGYWSDGQTWSGNVYRTTGSPWLGRAYDRGALQLTAAGTFSIRFTGDNAAFEYAIEGHRGAIGLTRQPF